MFQGLGSTHLQHDGGTKYPKSALPKLPSFTVQVADATVVPFSPFLGGLGILLNPFKQTRAAILSEVTGQPPRSGLGFSVYRVWGLGFRV